MASFKRGLFGAIPLSALLLGVAAGQYSGWNIPPEGKDQKSPLKPTAGVLKKGKGIYDKNCAKCHGPQGKGDGPDADQKDMPADLSDTFRAPLNPDGVMYYKVWNGHPPQMPAFKSTLTRDEVWTVVEYAKSLRVPEKQ